MISKAELDALFRADDEARAEHAHWMAQREPVASPLVERNDGDGGVVYKTVEDATAKPAQPDADWSGWERWMRGHLDNEREALLDIVADGMVAMFDQERAAIERKLAELRTENAELRGMIEVTLRLFTAETKAAAADVVNLRKHHDVA
jgi:hypothetical protein